MFEFSRTFVKEINVNKKILERCKARTFSNTNKDDGIIIKLEVFLFFIYLFILVDFNDNFQSRVCNKHKDDVGVSLTLSKYFCTLRCLCPRHEIAVDSGE